MAAAARHATGGPALVPLRLFLHFRVLRWRNIIRHHFDGGTLLRLGLLALVMVFAFGRSPTDIGTRPEAFVEPGSGARWLRMILVLLLPTLILLHRRASSLRGMSAESTRLHALAVEPAVIRGWARWRYAALLAGLMLLSALPALPGGPSTLMGMARALLLSLAVAAVGIGAWRWAGRRVTPGGAARRARPAATPGARRRWTMAFPGGAVSALVRRDLLHLVRSAPGPLVLAALALLLLPLLTARAPADAVFLTVGVVQGVLVVLQLNALLTLFERDAIQFAFFKLLDLPGRTLWKARVVLTLGLLGLPTIPALLVAWIRQPEPILGGSMTLLVFLGLPLLGGLLFANIGVALVPRVGLAALFLNVALGLIAFLWFFVPIAVPPLLLILLVFWGRRAPRAFDRLEAA